MDSWQRLSRRLVAVEIFLVKHEVTMSSHYFYIILFTIFEVQNIKITWEYLKNLKTQTVVKCLLFQSILKILKILHLKNAIINVIFSEIVKSDRSLFYNHDHNRARIHNEVENKKRSALVDAFYCAAITLTT